MKRARIKSDEERAEELRERAFWRDCWSISFYLCSRCTLCFLFLFVLLLVFEWGELVYTTPLYTAKWWNNYPTTDVLYTFVNGSDPVYKKLLKEYHLGDQIHIQRIRDNGEFKYSLRSLDKYAGSWIRNVYLIVATQSQIPEWLDTTKVKIITHEQFIEPQYYPTFGSSAIEYQLHRIENLSETFIYMNDDFFFGRNVFPWDFITKSGGSRIFFEDAGTPSASRVNEEDDRLASLALTNRLLDRTYFSEPRNAINHVPYVWNKSIWKEIWQLWPEQLNSTTFQKLRTKGIVPEQLYAFYLIYSKKHPYEIASDWSIYPSNVFVMVTSDAELVAQNLKEINKWMPKFYCFNDDRGKFPDPKLKVMMAEFFDNYYPNPSKYEKKI